MGIRKIIGAGTAAVLAVAVAVVTAPAAPAAAPVAGAFNVVSPTRLLDTRVGVGAPRRKVAGGATVTFTAIPRGVGAVSAVALTITEVNPTAGGFLTVFAGGTARPLASILDFQRGQTVSNFAVSTVGANGGVSIYNGSSGTVDLLADISGYFTGGPNAGAPGTLVPMPATRFLDTRTGVGAARRPAASASVTKVKVAGLHGIPVGASAVVVNITAVSSTASGFITAFPGDPMPRASIVDYGPRESRANLGLIELGADGTLSLYNGSNKAVDLLADISGYFVGTASAIDGPAVDGAFLAQPPVRIFDSRGPGGRPAGAQSISKICILTTDPTDPTCPTDPGLFSIFRAIVVTVTAVHPSARGYFTLWNGTGAIPRVSANNFSSGSSSFAGSLALPVNADGTISIYNGSHGTADVIIDVTGYVLNNVEPSPAPGRSNAKSAQGVSSQLAAALARVRQLASRAPAVPVRISYRR